MNYSSNVVINIRTLGQRIGILRPIVRTYRRLFRTDYEAAFDRVLFSTIRAGDIVWDVGANIGLYTVKFSDAVGPTGSVVAFEPSPSTVKTLASRVEGLSNVRIEAVALSDDAGTMPFYASKNGSVTDGLACSEGETIVHQIEVRRGDGFMGYPVPSIVKIDVEGFELEVIRGLVRLLPLPQVRAVFVEVHFQTLATRGVPYAPAEMTRLLTSHGYDVKWIDPSHFVGRKGA